MTTIFIGAKHDNEFYGWPQTAEQRIKQINEFLGRRGTGAKHCSSLCSQSEGDGYVANLSEIYCGLCSASTVAHFARKVRVTNT